MNKLEAILIAEAIGLLAFMVWIGRPSDQVFYTACIDQQIAQCKQQVDLIGSPADGKFLPETAALEKLQFYQEYREELIDQMIKDKIKLEQKEVAKFLTRASNEFANGKPKYTASLAN